MIKTELEIPKKIKLGIYPYTFARVSAMKAKLINKSEYHKLLKMSVSEITAFLQEYEFKESIDGLAASYKGIELIERALIDNLVKTFNKLKRISSDELAFMINIYLGRWDYTNIKTILRGKLTNTEHSYIKSLLIPLGTLSMEFLESLIDLSPEEIINKFKLLDIETQKMIIKKLKEANDLMIVENLLDKYYYNQIINISQSITPKGSFIQDFLMHEIDIINIKVLLKLKKANVEKEKIKEFLLFNGHLNKETLNTLAESEDLDEFRKKLLKTRYKNLIIDFKESLINLELILEKYLVQKSVLAWHKHPVSAIAILSYMFAKEIEVNNINSIIRGKQLGLEDDFIENNLVVI